MSASEKKQRALTQRGLAQWQTGKFTMEQLMASDEYSTEIKPGMQVTEMDVNQVSLVDPATLTQTPAPATADSVTAPAALTVEDLTAKLATANESLLGASANVEALTQTVASLTEAAGVFESTIKGLQAELAALKPAAVTGVRSLQIKLGKPISVTATTPHTELAAMHTELAATAVKAFPVAQVSVAGVTDDKTVTPPAQVNISGAFRLSKRAQSQAE